MEPITTRTPTSLGDISVSLLESEISSSPKQARFSIQVLDQNGLVADRVALIDLLDRIRQEAALRILGE